jgi:tRNA nucleotidyltransferase (CCA-adding enzyme)
LYLLCLLDDLTEKGVARVTLWLGMQPKDRLLLNQQLPAAKRLLKLVRQRRSSPGEPKNSTIYFWLNDFSLEIILFLMARSENEQFRQWISLYMTDLRREKVILDGDALISLGLTPGRYFKDIFKALLEARLNGEIVTRDDEIALVQKNFSGTA